MHMEQTKIYVKENIKRYNTKMFRKEDIKGLNPNWPEISDHSYRISVVGDSGSGKTNALLNLINHEADIDKIYWYTKDPYEAKCQLLISSKLNVN